MDQQIEKELKIGDKLAIDRTKMALERTLMAAIRTSVSMISFGFTIAKFFQDFKTLEGVKNPSTLGSRNVGLWLVLIGTIYILGTSLQYTSVSKNLQLSTEKSRIPFSLILSWVITLLGIALSLSFYSNYLSLGLTQ